MYIELDFVMQYLDHKKMSCTFVLQGGKSLKGIIDGRDTYTIFVQGFCNEYYSSREIRFEGN